MYPFLSDVVIGRTELAASATEGFLRAPRMSGAPTGTPVSYTGFDGSAPMALETGRSRLWVYTSGAGWVGGFWYAGNWASSTGYTKNEIVRESGGSYFCKLGHTSSSSNRPASGGSWTTFWDLLAEDGADGSNGSNGSDGADGADGSVWHNGSGAPAGGTGSIGDYYIDNGSGDYHEKTGASTWTPLGSLQGPAGSNGVNGSDGSDGADGNRWHQGSGAPSSGLGSVDDFYFNFLSGEVHHKTGSTTWGVIANLTGPAGSNGTNGTNGTNGSDGSDGADGADGATWHSGSGDPSGGTGEIGDFYFDTSDGDVFKKTGASTWSFQVNLKGATGATGAQGPQGNTGPAGSSDLPLGTIIMWHEDYSGAPTYSSISSTWARCNGSSGRPNCRDRFLRCKTSDGASTGTTGGQTGTELEVTLTMCNVSLCGTPVKSMVEDVQIDTSPNLPEHFIVEYLIKIA